MYLTDIDKQTLEGLREQKEEEGDPPPKPSRENVATMRNSVASKKSNVLWTKRSVPKLLQLNNATVTLKMTLRSLRET